MRDGCFNIRKERGSSGILAHAFGIAVDINAATNPFRGAVTWSAPFLKVWRDLGWICGADWSPTSEDGMHFQWEGFDFRFSLDVVHKKRGCMAPDLLNSSYNITSTNRAMPDIILACR
ncbi:M15 family metallopeptidase [Dyadobacter fermentans]|uniref:M15 family metallopeptidase n=1 Tax=Dyadobacter fermentans TaxID=94254 RepID=UPI001CBE61CC|nr:M15 family metallopeptidase [Dyadobacter fermentans]